MYKIKKKKEGTLLFLYLSFSDINLRKFLCLEMQISLYSWH